MRFALISDIHGNLEALTAVLSDLEKQKVDKIHCLGDVVGYGSNPRECLDLINKNCDIKLVGNHEFMMLGIIPMEKCNNAAQISYQWTRKEITDFELAIIEEFQIQSVIENCLLIHSSPYRPKDWNYILNTEQATLAFESLREHNCFIGHSHLPMIFTEIKGEAPRLKIGHNFIMDPDYRYIINVGSVGQPRDNDPRASYVIVDTEEWDIYFNRVEYDVKTTQAKMEKAALPKVLIDRLSIGR